MVWGGKKKNNKRIGNPHVFRVRHAHAVLHDLLAALDLLHNPHQLPGVIRHFLRERADAMRHVQDGGPDLVGLRLQDGVLKKDKNTTTNTSEDGN